MEKGAKCLEPCNMLMLLIFLVFFAGGCAAPVAVVKKRLFFPPPPTEPKIEWKGVYTNQHSFPKTARQKRMDQFLGQAPSIGFSRPIDVVSNGEGILYVADPDSRDVFVYDLVKYEISSLDKGGNGIFTLPVGLALDSDGKLYVVDRMKRSVLVFGPNREPLFSFGSKEELLAPVGIAVDDKNGKIYVTDIKKNTVNAYDKKGKLLYTIGEDREVISFNFPLDVDVFSDGTLAVADTMNARVQLIDSSGNHILNFGKRGDSYDSFELIKGIAVDREDHIYVSDTGSNAIKVYNREGHLLMAFGAYFKSPSGIAPGGFGMISGISTDKKNGIFVADQMNIAVQVFQYLDENYLKENPLPKLEGFEQEEKQKP